MSTKKSGPLATTANEILAMIQRGQTAVTDRLDALKELGFERKYPTATNGWRAHIWMRRVDHGWGYVSMRGGWQSYQRRLEPQSAHLTFVA